jgi:hypothetical protein
VTVHTRTWPGDLLLRPRCGRSPTSPTPAAAAATAAKVFPVTVRRNWSERLSGESIECPWSQRQKRVVSAMRTARGEPVVMLVLLCAYRW